MFSKYIHGEKFFQQSLYAIGGVCIICVLVTVLIAAVRQYGENAVWVGKGIFDVYFHTINHRCRKSVQEVK